MSVHSISEGSPEHPAVPPVAAQPAVEPAPASILDLVNRTLADPGRTDNATRILTSVSKGAARVVVTIAIVLIVGTILLATLIHSAGLGPALGGAVAAGGVSALAGGGYVWNRRTAKRKAVSRRRS